MWFLEHYFYSVIELFVIARDYLNRNSAGKYKCVTQLSIIKVEAENYYDLVISHQTQLACYNYLLFERLPTTLQCFLLRH